MNDVFSHGAPQAENAARFDRLVDGELSPAEYRALLASLDDEPDGWRCCALAFLEAQAMGSELASLRQSLDTTLPSQVGTPARHGRPTTPFPAKALLAIAASFVVAFGLGLATSKYLLLGVQETLPGGNGISRPELAEVDLHPPTAADNRHEVLRPIGNVSLVVNGPGGEQSEAGNLPLYDAGDNIAQYLEQSGPGLAPELVELLERRGHTVERHE